MAHRQSIERIDVPLLEQSGTSDQEAAATSHNIIGRTSATRWFHDAIRFVLV